MTPRERWLSMFAGERTDLVACDYWATAEVTCRLLRELGANTSTANVFALYDAVHEHD